ncbi:uncharacterized protein LOC126792223 [Argentina anserina]|uniref:uncharacterized protein LOC126792223 n=1 Tax=Argentina anserina TaxID=57926 RepID=UPI00217687E7|nr:uncharacterized protein LOC126792223 [Potentilla anserina]
MEKKLSKRFEIGRHWKLSQSTDEIYEVSTEDSNILFRCFPCSHAIQVMNKANHILYGYIENYWKIEFYKSAHQHPIYPLSDLDKPNPSSFGDSTMQPPITRVPAGRPRTRRICSFGEEARPMQCERCKKMVTTTAGHALLLSEQ